MSHDESDDSSDSEGSEPRKSGLVQVRNHRVMVSRKAVFIFAGSALALAFLFFSFPKLNKDRQISSLVQSLSSENSDTRRRALEKLSKRDDDVTPWFAEALKEAKESDRATLVKALGLLGATKHDIIPLLLKSYKTDSSDLVKKNAALALCKNAHGRSELSPILMSMTKETDVSIQRAAIKALTETGAMNAELLTALQSLLTSPNKDLARQAAKALLELAPKDHPARSKAEILLKQ